MKTSTINRSLALLISMAIAAPIASADQISRRSDCASRTKPNPFPEGMAVYIQSIKDEQTNKQEWVPIGGRHRFDFGEYLFVDCSTACFVIGDNEVAVCDIYHDGMMRGTCVSNQQKGLGLVWSGWGTNYKIATNEIECRVEQAAAPQSFSTMTTLVPRATQAA